MPCPLCRTEFEIPENGVAGLPARTHVKEPFSNNREPYCEKHDVPIQMFCFDCSMNVCSACCREEHKTHKFQRIEAVVDQLSTSIDDDIKQITSSIERFHSSAAQLETENNKALYSIKATELEVKKRSREIKQLVDRHENHLLRGLQILKSAAEIEVKSHKDALHFALSEMESFRTSSLELRSKGSPSDITQAANDIHQRAQELLQAYVIPSEYHAPSYEFTPVNIGELLRDDQNFIGHVAEVKDSGNAKSC